MYKNSISDLFDLLKVKNTSKYVKSIFLLPYIPY